MVMKRTAKKKRQVTDLSQAAVIEFLVGKNPRGPAKCIKCRKPFKRGDAWRRLTSPPDKEFGSYSIGVHQKCS